MKLLRKIIILLLPLLCLSAVASAEETLRPVNSAFMLEAGSSHLHDSYLSPLKYTGWHLGFDYERTQAMKFSPAKWRQQLNLGIVVDRGENPARNASLLQGEVRASWSMSRVWRLPHNLTVTGGGIVRGDIGGIYNSRNGNNPASLIADLTLGVTGSLRWDCRVGRLPVGLRWQTTLPLFGTFFSPEYDELYYEIYLGNRHGLAHFANPANFFRWENLVTADMAFGNTTLRVGFRSDIYSTGVNNITTRSFSYSFVLGVVTDWLSASPRRPLPGAAGDKVEWAY